MIPTSRLILLGVAVILTLALSLVYARTTFGIATTALSERPPDAGGPRVAHRLGGGGQLGRGRRAGGVGRRAAGSDHRRLDRQRDGADRRRAGGGVDRWLALVPADAGRRHGHRDAAVAVRHSRSRHPWSRRCGSVRRDHRSDRPTGPSASAAELRRGATASRRFRGDPHRMGGRRRRGGGRSDRVGAERQRDRGAHDVAAGRDPVAVAHGAARLRGSDVAGSDHAFRGGRPDRRAVGGKRRAAVPGRAAAGACWARFRSASSWDCRPPGREGSAWRWPRSVSRWRSSHWSSTTTRSPGGRPGSRYRTAGSFKVFGIDFDSFLHVDRFAYLVLGFVLVLAVLVANLRRSALWTADDRGPRQRASRRRPRRQRRHDEAVGVRDRRCDHRPGRGAGRLQRAGGDLLGLLRPGQPDRGRLQRRRRRGQRPGRPVRPAPWSRPGSETRRSTRSSASVP